MLIFKTILDYVAIELVLKGLSMIGWKIGCSPSSKQGELLPRNNDIYDCISMKFEFLFLQKNLKN